MNKEKIAKIKSESGNTKIAKTLRIIRNAYCRKDKHEQRKLNQKIAEALALDQSEDVFFLPLSRSESNLLGEMHLFADEGNIALSFRESITLIDYYCYVRIFSEKDISEIIPDLEYCKDLGHGWYYVNLY